MVHRHPLEGDLDVTGGLQRVGVAARTFRIDVDETHLDRGERVLEFHLALGLNARFDALVDPLLLGAPIDVAFRLEDIFTTAAEAEGRAAHRFNGYVSGEDEEVGPADVLSVFALDRPKQPAGLVEIAVVRPAV